MKLPLVTVCFIGTILVTFTPESLYGQNSKVKGSVIDNETGKVVGYTSILNYSRQIRQYSNTAGEFDITAEPGDTLVFYATGYYYQKIIAEEEMFVTDKDIVILIRPQVFDIAEARILGMGTYEEFKNKFAQMEREKTQTEVLNESLANAVRDVAIEAYNKAMVKRRLESGGIRIIGVGANIYTRDERERMRLSKIVDKEQILDMVYERFNPVVVKTVTGMTNDDDIIEFMIFCDFPDEYIIEVNEYDLMEAIASRYEMFKKKKEAKKNMQNRIEWTDNSLQIFS